MDADKSTRSQDKSLSKSERRERREREDREAKDRARSSRRPESGGDADAEKHERRERRTREEKEAKDRARGSRSSNPGTSERQEQRDREDRKAKERARGSRKSSAGSTGTPRVGAYSETDGPKLPSKSSRSRDNERRDRDAKAKSRASGSRAARPGVQSVASSESTRNSKSSRDISSRRESERAKMSEIIPDAPKLDVDNVKEESKEDEFAVEASLIDEQAEANDAARKQEEENRKLRQQMQEMEDRRRQEEAERVLREQEAVKKRKKKILCAAVVFLLVAGGGVAAYFLTRSSKADPTSTDGTAKEPTSPPDEDTATPVVSATTSPISTGTTSPSSSPTVPSLFDPPTEEDCEAMKNGKSVLNQEEMKEHTFAVGMDVSFSLDVDFENVYVPDLEKAIREFLPQTLAQCPDVNIGRRLRSNDPNRWVVGNVIVSTQHDKDVLCSENAGLACYRLSVALQVLLKDEIEKTVLTITTYIAEAFGKAPIMQLLKLTTPYVKIALVSANGLDPTNAPSPSPSSAPTTTTRPSQSPTSRPSAAPVVGPTTKRPTNAPSATLTTPQPSSSPTFAPTAATLSPTEGPTKFPTFNPTKRPTVLPATGVPTELASSTPTKEPTPGPTQAPSKSPTDMPSIQSSATPSSPPTKFPSLAPSSPPTGAPTALTFTVSFPPGMTYKKDGPGNTGCLLNGGACYSDACAAEDTSTWANYVYYTESWVYPAEGFDWDTYPVWNLGLVIEGWDCAANFCAGVDDCCWDDPLMGGTQFDLSLTDFVFHEDTSFQVIGYGVKTRVSIDGQPVKYFYDGAPTLGVTGGTLMTVNSGGYCGKTAVYTKVTLRP